MAHQNLKAGDKKTLEQYNDAKKRIHQRTQSVPNETGSTQRERIAVLKTDFVKFCQYYFPHYITEPDGTITPFAWFHKKAVRLIQPNTLTVLEWHREAAKSVFADIMLPLFLYAKGELTGMVIASANEDKAAKLLSDVQAEFESNQLWINDYGQLAALGSWQTGQFSTTDGIGFWGFGVGQSPRGIREQEKRPNYCVVDDADTKERCKNESRVMEAVEWIREDLFGAIGLRSGARFVIAGNRIHRNSIVSNMVGDVEPKHPINAGVQHVKAFAIENPRTHAKAEIEDPTSVPAWKERYSKDHFRKRFELIGYGATRREYFHEHIERGLVFRPEWIEFEQPPRLVDFEDIVIYTDPSFKGAKSNDYKATAVVGLYRSKGSEGGKLKYMVLDAFCRQVSVSAMVKANYDFYDWIGERGRYFMEANAMQSSLLDDFDTEGSARGYYLPISGDTAKKVDKFQRIENLTPLFERGMICFNADKRGSSDMQNGIGQLLAFPTGHDDFPDAIEGAINKLSAASRSRTNEPRTGKFTKFSNRQ